MITSITPILELPKTSFGVLHASVLNKELTVTKYKVNITFRWISVELYSHTCSPKKLLQLYKPFAIRPLWSPSDGGLPRARKHEKPARSNSALGASWKLIVKCPSCVCGSIVYSLPQVFLISHIIKTKVNSQRRFSLLYYLWE